MFKQKVVLEVKGSGDKLHQLEVPGNTSLGELYDVLNVMRSFVVQEMNKRQEQAEESCESKDSDVSCEENEKNE